MKAVFADTGYWIALWNPQDELHRKALSVARRLGAVEVVTTRGVLTEALNFTSGMGELLLNATPLEAITSGA